MEGNNLKIITNTFGVLTKRCSSKHFVYITATSPRNRNNYYLYFTEWLKIFPQFISSERLEFEARQLTLELLFFLLWYLFNVVEEGLLSVEFLYFVITTT